MERNLFAYERLMLAGGLPYTVLFAARIGGPIEAHALGDALDWLQRRHPALRAAVAGPRLRPRFVMPARPIGMRVVVRTGADDWRHALIEEFDQALPRDTGPLARLVWVRGEEASELILVADHVVCDGQSVLILMRELMGRLLRPDAARPEPPRFGSIDDLFGRVPLRVSLAERAAAAAGSPFLWSRSALTRRRRTPPAPSYVVQWELDRTVARALDERTRAEKVSIYAALATAFLRAVLAVRPAAFNKLICPVDPRPFFSFRGADSLFSTPSHVKLSLDRTLDGQFWSQARRLGADLLAGYVRLRPDRMARIGELLHALIDGAVNAALHGPRTNDLTLSHLGNAALPSEPARPAEALATLGSSPWSDATAVMSLAAGDLLSFCLVSRESVLAHADALRLRDHAMMLLDTMSSATNA